jgi:riboflavin kinase/FMN adenylyltransferase
MAVHTLSPETALPEGCRGGAVTVGNFDGVHRGHRHLLGELAARAAALGGPAVALTFDPHPLQILRPQQFPPLLTTVPDRAELMQRCGVTEVVVLRTTPELLHLTAREFFDAILVAKLRPRVVVPGFNFHYGHNREGTVEVLAAQCREARIDFDLVRPLEIEGGPVSRGGPVSSSRIRAELLRGDVAAAAGLLGRPYRLRGTVGVGQRRGRTLGFPTANLEGVATVVPANGVYAVRAWIDGRAWPAAANVGPNPTFGEEARKIEAHVIGFDGDLYGRELAVDFVERLRDTRPFAGVAELLEQLGKDVAQARQLASLDRPGD